MPIHEEALSVLVERNGQYPPFKDEAARVCGVINALFPSLNLTPRQYTIILVCMKLCRESNSHKRDNLLDLINYVSFLDGME